MTVPAQRISLIQLVSEQTMQNLLPVLRLAPSRLIHLATPRTVSRSAWIADAARRAQCPVELETVSLSAMPTIVETRAAVLSAIEREAEAGHEPVINFTGGTKLMSIGAYAAGMHHRCPSLYVDTQDSVFRDGQTGAGLEELLEADFSFTPILGALTVHAVAGANGCPRITGGHDWRPCVAFAEYLLEDESAERELHDFVQCKGGLFESGREPRNPRGWLDAMDRSFNLPGRATELAIDSEILETGARPGTARLPRDSKDELAHLAGHKVPDFPSRYYAASTRLQRAVGFLSGGWWEVILAERMRCSGIFRDIRWSVEVGERQGPVLEEDVVALDGVRIAYVSCKRGGGPRARLLPLLEEVDSRARALGGTFTRRFLAVRHAPERRTLKDLRQRAAERGIRLIFPDDLRESDPFSHD